VGLVENVQSRCSITKKKKHTQKQDSDYDKHHEENKQGKLSNKVIKGRMGAFD
jgi:hypothetical protein